MRIAVTTLLFASLAGLLVYMTRKRLRLAFTAGAIVYFVLLPIRLLFSADEVADRFDDYVWPITIIFVIWLIASRISIEYQKRKPPPVPKPRRRLFGRRGP